VGGRGKGTDVLLFLFVGRFVGVEALEGRE